MFHELLLDLLANFEKLPLPPQSDSTDLLFFFCLSPLELYIHKCAFGSLGLTRHHHSIHSLSHGVPSLPCQIGLPPLASRHRARDRNGTWDCTGRVALFPALVGTSWLVSCSWRRTEKEQGWSAPTVASATILHFSWWLSDRLSGWQL